MNGRKTAILLGGAAMAAAAPAAAETVAYRYDARGRLIQVVRTTGGASVTTAYAFDKADNRIAATVAAGSGPDPGAGPGTGPGPAPSGGVIVLPGNPYRIIPIG